MTFFASLKELAKRYKMHIFVLLAMLALGYIIPLLYMSDASIRVMERNLMNLDLTRSTYLFLFDALILASPFVILLLLYLNYVSYRKLKSVKASVLLAMLFLMPIFGVQSEKANSTITYTQEKPLAKYIFIITFDGARADVFWRVGGFIKSKLNESVYADHIVTVYPTVTYPGHISLLTGTWPQIHGTENNPPRTEFGSRPYSSYLRTYHRPKVEDILDVASKYGYMTAVFAAPSTMSSIIGNQDTYKVYGYGTIGTMNNTLAFLEDNLATIKSKGLIVFMHLVDTDSAGHDYGTDSIEYRNAMRKNIEQVGRLFNKLEQLGLLKDSVIVVTADHGMYGNRHHNVFPPLVSDIPLWMWGRPFKRGYKLGGGRIVDIAPTLYYILGIPKPNYVVGVTLFTALNSTYIKMVRGSDLNLEQMEKSEIKWAMGLIYRDLVFWHTIIVLIAWVMIVLLANFVSVRRQLKRGLKGNE